MKRRGMFALMIFALFCIALPALAFADEESAPQAKTTDPGIRNLIEGYVAKFNARDVDGIMALYTPQAKIKETSSGNTLYIDPQEYRPKLREKMEGYERKGTTITGFDIQKLKVAGSSAAITVKLKVKQGIFRVTREGAFELAKADGGWKITKDDM